MKRLFTLSLIVSTLLGAYAHAQTPAADEQHSLHQEAGHPSAKHHSKGHHHKGHHHKAAAQPQ